MRRDKRRTHDKAIAPQLTTCSNCGAAVQYHRVCPECGYRCTACLGTDTVVRREALKDLKFVPWISDDIDEARASLEKSENGEETGWTG